MKVTVKVDDLKTGFKNLATALQSGSKSVSSILTNVDYSYIRISAYENNQILFETAREGIYARSLHQASVEQPGVIVIPCSYLYGISYPKPDVHVETEDNNVHLTCGSMDVQLNGIINQNALTINPVEEIKHTIELPMKAFIRSRYRCGFPQMHTGSGQRPLIRHLCENGIFGAHANDKYSLAIYEIAEPNVPDFNIVLPVGFEDGLLSIFAKDEKVWMGVNDKTIRMTSPSFDIQFPKIQEPQPFSLVKDVKGQVSRILSVEQGAEFVFDAEEALKAVNTVSSLQYTAKAKQFRIILDVKDDHVVVSSSTSFGKSNNRFTAQVNKGQGTQISCHSSVLQTFLNLLAKAQFQSNTWFFQKERQINTLKNEAMTVVFTSVH